MKALFSCLASRCTLRALFSKALFPVLMTATAIALMSGRVTHAQTTFATTAVGTSAPATQTVTVNLQAAGTVAKVEVLTMGTANLDFTESGADNCAGISTGDRKSVV